MATLCAALGAGGSLAAANKDGMWHAEDGTEMTGQLSDVVGPLALITGKKRVQLLPLRTMTDEELRRVAAFLAARREGAWKDSTLPVAQDVKGKLQVLRDGKLVEFDPASRREPDLYLVYFSAGWCAPCHRFTPELVKAYERMQAKAPGRIEVIFISWDRDRAEQAAYVREAGMPWPVLRYSALGGTRVIERWAGKGIPCLVGLTRSGVALFHSYRGEEYIGPDAVLESCEQLLPLLDERSVTTLRERHRLAVLEHVAAARNGSSPPKPYLVGLDPEKLGAVQVPDLELELGIDERGQVRQVHVRGTPSADLERLITTQAEAWLFLPAVKDGVAAAVTVQVPVHGGGVRRAATPSGS